MSVDPLRTTSLSSVPPSSVRATSRDRTTLSSPSNSSLGSNPFREASLDFGPPFPRSSTSSPLTLPDPSPYKAERPALLTSPSNLARELASALGEDLPEPAVTPPEMSRSASEKRRITVEEQIKSPSLMQQFRTGTGWFAPVVPPEAPLTREEKAAKEKARIEKLKNGGNGERRPNLLKRMSSGVELFGYSPGGGAR